MTDFDHCTTESLVVDEHVILTLPDLCRACGGDSGEVMALVGEGLLHPTGQGPEDWQFSGQALPTARNAVRLAHDLELSIAAAAVVMDLLAEVEALRSQTKRYSTRRLANAMLP